VEAPLVRAYLEALPDLPPDGRSLERVRFCLSTLLGPDVRYLVAAVLGPGAADIARVAASILRAAGAPTGVFGEGLAAATVDGAPIDDALLARAGTLTAASGYQLADAGRDLGELTRREAETILALNAFADASQRVALLVDTAVAADDALHAVRPDLVVLGDVDRSAAERAIALVPEGRPLVTTSLAGEARAYVEERVGTLGIPAMLGGRDHAAEEGVGELAFSVRGERYVTFAAVPGIPHDALATGIAAALALGVMGIRMREEWVTDGLDHLRAAAVMT
jgi:hypothetical protein